MHHIRLTPRQVRFPAMGTIVSILFVGDLPPGAVGAVRNLFVGWEALLSRFRPESELSRVNRAAGTPTTVGPLLRNVLTVAVDAARATDGLFDPTLGRQMSAIGYHRSFEGPLRLVGGSFVRDLPAGGWRDIHINAEDGNVTIPAGTALDFGGIAKGMAVDAAASLLAEFGVVTALVNAGGDMRVARDDAAEWQIGFDEAKDRAVTLAGGGIATSGVTKRRWMQDGVQRHHLIDPRTGLPSQSELRSVSVAASTCAQAEVAAKVALILGLDAGTALLERLGLPGLMTLQDDSIRETATWPAQVAA